LRKYITLKNIIIGLIAILYLFGIDSLEFIENIIVGISGLISKLGFRGIIEGIEIDIFGKGKNYAMMGEDPTQSSSHNTGIGNRLDTTDTSKSDLPEKNKQGDVESDKQKSPSKSDKQVENLSDSEKQKGSTQSNKQNESSSKWDIKRYRAERFRSIYDKMANDAADDAKKFAVNMEKAQDDQE
jgi:hypothetical protein